MDLVFLQSFGGFCALTYLSFAPQGLKQVLITGGIPPIGKSCTADDVYDAGFEQVVRQNEKYYKRFPEDVEIVCELVNYLAESEGGGVRKESKHSSNFTDQFSFSLITCVLNSLSLGTSSIRRHPHPPWSSDSWSFWFRIKYWF